MTMSDGQQWFLFGLLFFGAIGYVAFIRWRDRVWIDRNYGLENAKMMSFGVNYFGLASESSKLRTSSGLLLLLSDRLVYRSRFRHITLEINGDHIIGISHGTSHGGVKLHQPAMQIAFRTAEHERDAAAFKVPYPVQWMKAIQAGFLDGK